MSSLIDLPMHVLLYLSAHTHVEARGGHLPLSPSSLFFDTKPLSEPEACCSSGPTGWYHPLLSATLPLAMQGLLQCNARATRVAL